MNFLETLQTTLKTDPRFLSQDGLLLKPAIVDAASALDAGLIRLLLNQPTLKQHFFTEVDGILVFDKEKFQWVLNSKEFLPDSFTKYRNKIGLSANDHDLISASSEIALVWPYKDCVLEGGQDKEDEKRDEIFYNETLAPDEVGRLLAPKAFKNAVRYSADGEEPVETLNDDDNLIIKGNNLLALSSLLERYEGLVKCIYIDPPYYFDKNKSADAFNYNSNFKLSTWLSFMRSRLTIGYKLLKPGGVFLCHMGEDGYAYLKILMTELFGYDNFVETFIWRNTDNPDSLSKKSRASVEYIICFEKKKNPSIQYIGKASENGDAPLLNSGNSYHTLVFPPRTIRFQIQDGVYPPSKPDRVAIENTFEVRDHTNVNEVALSGEFKWGQPMLDSEIAKGTYFLVKTDKFSVRFQRVEATNMAPEKFIDDQYLYKAIGVGVNEDASSHLKQMGINFSYSKPESLLAFFLKAVTAENDVILDFFVGSGTTAAVAHKMGRRYIGVEQMDYIQTVTVPRLQKVIAGEQGGISKAQNWQGGGSFVYVELAEHGEELMARLESAVGSAGVQAVLGEATERGLLRPSVLPSELKEAAGDFAALSLAEQKRGVAELIDKNRLYVNAADMEDATSGLSDADKAFTRSFYGKEREA